MLIPILNPLPPKTDLVNMGEVGFFLLYLSILYVLPFLLKE